MGACGSENRFMGQLGHHLWGKPTPGKTVYLEGYPICLPELSSGLSYRARERPQMPLGKNNVPVTQASSILQRQQLRQVRDHF